MILSIWTPCNGNISMTLGGQPLYWTWLFVLFVYFCKCFQCLNLTNDYGFCRLPWKHFMIQCWSTSYSFWVMRRGFALVVHKYMYSINFCQSQKGCMLHRRAKTNINFLIMKLYIFCDIFMKINRKIIFKRSMSQAWLFCMSEFRKILEGT